MCWSLELSSFMPSASCVLGNKERDLVEEILAKQAGGLRLPHRFIQWQARNLAEVTMRNPIQSFMFLNERDIREIRKRETATLAVPFITTLPPSRLEKRLSTISSNLPISAAVLPHRGREGCGLQGEVEESRLLAEAGGRASRQDRQMELLTMAFFLPGPRQVLLSPGALFACPSDGEAWCILHQRRVAQTA